MYLTKKAAVVIIIIIVVLCFVSCKVYHEKESIFTPISLEDNNQALSALKETAAENAVANGLFDNACVMPK